MRARAIRGALSVLVAGSMLVLAPAPALAHPEACDATAAETAQSSAVFTVATAIFNVFNVFADLLPSEPTTAETTDAEQEGCLSEAEIAAFDDSGATLQPGETASSQNMRWIRNLPKTGQFSAESAIGSDLAFWGDYAFQGNYNGIQITDISDPTNPALVSQTWCPGSQNDVSIWRNLFFTSTDSRRSDDSCSSFSLGTSTTPSSTDPEAEYWEGIKVFDWSDPTSPEVVATVETDCGSHTHTLIPDGDRVLIYVSSYDTNVNAKDCRRSATPEEQYFDHDKISIVEVPLADPSAARLLGEVALFPEGGANAGTRGCHDITAYPEIGLAAGACMGEGVLLDISNPETPAVLDSVTDPNFAFWHSATFTNDGSKVIFTDELGGGTQPTCNPTVGDVKGADALYAINDGQLDFLSYFKIPRTQSNTENCVAHNGVVLPSPGRDLFVQAWYQGGTSVIDFTDPSKPREVAFFERGPLSNDRIVPGGAWSSYYYRGFIFANGLQEGLDVLRLTDPVAAMANRYRAPYLNAQTQSSP